MRVSPSHIFWNAFACGVFATLFDRTNAAILNAICSALLYLTWANTSGLSIRYWNHRGFLCGGTVGWARTTDLLFHRQAL